MSENERDFLGLAVDAHRKIPNKISVSEAMEAITGCKVKEFGCLDEDAAILEKLEAAARALIEQTHVSPIKTPRVNELGNAIEEPLLNACLSVGLAASWPVRRDGSTSRTGYPDIALDISGLRPAYLEAKVVKPGSDDSSFRSFYMSPSDRPKVCIDVCHLLIAFTHERKVDSEDGFEQYALTHYKIVDLARVSGNIKFEYQANNKAMYSGLAVVASG